MHYKDIDTLIFEYEAMSQKGTVSFIEKPVFCQLLDYYEDSSLYPKALEVINHAVEQHPYTEEFHIRRIKLLLMLGDFSQAEFLIGDFETYFPASVEAGLLRVELLLKRSCAEEALWLLEEMMATAPGEELPAVYFYTGLAQEQLDQYRYALHSFRRAALLDPQNKLILQKLWIFVERHQFYKESIHINRRILDRDPCAALAWYNLGQAHFCLEEYEPAADAFECALWLDDTLKFIYFDGAEAALKMGDPGRAAAFYEQALEAVGASAEVYLGLGRCCREQGAWQEAFGYFELALIENPANAVILYQMGLCCKQLGRLKDARVYLGDALRLDDLCEAWHAAYAEVCWQLGDLRTAEQHYLLAAESAPWELDFAYQYLTFLLETAQVKKAIDFFTPEFLAEAPLEAAYLKTACLWLGGSYDEASQLLSVLLDETPGQALLMFDLVPQLLEDAELQSFLKRGAIKK